MRDRPEAGAYWEKLLEQALRCELAVEQFWRLTPLETFQSIEAYLWRAKNRQKEEIRMAWLGAALVRAKKLPKLAQLLTEKAKPLHGEELAKRRREFAEMTQNIDLGAINGSRQQRTG